MPVLLLIAKRFANISPVTSRPCPMLIRPVLRLSVKGRSGPISPFSPSFSRVGMICRHSSERRKIAPKDELNILSALTVDIFTSLLKRALTRTDKASHLRVIRSFVVVLWRLLHLKYSLPLSPVSNHMYESVSLSALFLKPIFAQSVFLIQARIESFSKVSPPDKVSPFFCTAFLALFTVSCKPRYSITAATVDFARISRPTFVRVARLATSFPVKYGNLSAAVASPASAVRVASFGCLRGCVEIRASHYKYQDLASHSRGFLLPLQKPLPTEWL